MRNFILFSVPSLIWGSTWLIIKFQLGVVDPIVSVVYRFLLAAIILFIYCWIAGLDLRYKPKDHFFIVLQGFFLFGINYWLVYLAEINLKSGLVAILFSLIIFLNIFNGAIFLRSPVRRRVLAGGAMGIIGTALVFQKDLLTFNFSNENSLALIFALMAVLSASFGNIVSARNQKNNLPVIQTNAYGMLYGALSMFLVSLITGAQFNFDMSFPYIASLIYLTIFGSIVAFGSFLTLLGKIGPDKAAYVTLVIPIIALILSTIFEDYMLSVYAAIGVILIMVGNVIVLMKKQKYS